MASITPCTDCPHVSKSIRQDLPTELIDVQRPCGSCQSTEENWICLSCSDVYCSRHVQGHMIEHYHRSGHAIAASFVDLSVWCYLCDSYITAPALRPLLRALYTNKFPGEVPPPAFGGPDTTPPAAPPEESRSASDSDNEPDERTEELLLQLAALELQKQRESAGAPPVRRVLSELTLECVAAAIRDGTCRKIIVMTGAGISVAAGIPDFRSPKTGLYHNLQKYQLPYPQAIFELEYFEKNPKPFFVLAKELYPGNFAPTTVHYFIKLLENKKVLLRNFTQNIDTLERVAGVSEDMLVEAHGSFATAKCTSCKAPANPSDIRAAIFADQVPKCTACTTGVVKPDIVFFGESLPRRFFERAEADFAECDLLIVIGTSLQVQPFASLISRVKDHVPRVLINNEKVGQTDPLMALLGLGRGFMFDSPTNIRDVCVLGDCQAEVRRLCRLLGWEEELDQLIAAGKGRTVDSVLAKI